MNRRQLLQSGLVAAAGGLIGRSAAIGAESETRAVKPIEQRLCLFTDHLDDFGYSYQDTASMLRQLGIAGPDLTVRPGGLVKPEAVAQELPRAAAAFKDEGLSIPMISTGITERAQLAAEPTLRAMSQLGIRYYKLGYYKYNDVTRWKSELESTRRRLAELVQLGKPLEVTAGVHNHAGETVGGAVWDLARLVEPLDEQHAGAYFDPAHATIEGANHAWKLNFQLIAPRLKMLAVKDFVWEKTGGQWRTRWCPLGEGMVRWPEFFAMLSRVPFSGPVSLHIEYEVPGKTRVSRFENSLAAAERDLKFLRRTLSESYTSKSE